MIRILVIMPTDKVGISYWLKHPSPGPRPGEVYTIYYGASTTRVKVSELRIAPLVAPTSTLYDPTARASP